MIAGEYLHILAHFELKCIAIFVMLLLQDKQRRVPLAGTPLADITPRHRQLTPVAPDSLTNQLSMRAGAGAAPSAFVTPAVAAKENVEEQCLSAGRWLRGLADECLENVYTPARLQPDDTADDTQVGHSAIL